MRRHCSCKRRPRGIDQQVFRVEKIILTRVIDASVSYAL